MILPCCNTSLLRRTDSGKGIGEKYFPKAPELLTYGDSSTQNITATVSWTSATTSVATISGTGTKLIKNGNGWVYSDRLRSINR
jgi:hypothetical protein